MEPEKMDVDMSWSRYQTRLYSTGCFHSLECSRLRCHQYLVSDLELLNTSLSNKDVRVPKQLIYT